MWDEIKAESERQDGSIFQTSSVMAVAAAQRFPDGVRWFAASARAGAARTGQVFASARLLEMVRTKSRRRRENRGEISGERQRAGSRRA
jgi:hypothetical protein